MISNPGKIWVEKKNTGLQNRGEAKAMPKTLMRKVPKEKMYQVQRIPRLMRVGGSERCI